MNPEGVLSVLEVNKRVKLLLEDDEILRDVQVAGEISNFKHHRSSGHFYFTLKEAGSVLRCVMFRGKSRSLDFEPADGMKVVAHGYIGVYDVRGEYQLYVDGLQPEGLGSLYLAFEKLKKKLESEGLFSAEIKKAIPVFPQRIGVVTSETAAALRDILNVLKRRFPNIEIIVSPCLVQGGLAPPSIVKAIEACSRWGKPDTIIVTRGGGSIEDLWAFNTEPVARAIFECPVPVISGVGHETDFTIADFVADLRAPTPSAAAELAVPEKWKLQDTLRRLKRRAITGMFSHFQRIRRRVEEVDFDYLQRIIIRAVDGMRNRVDELQERLHRSSGQRLSEADRELNRRKEKLSTSIDWYLGTYRQSLELEMGKLVALEPQKVLDRGYSICLKLPERSVVSSVATVSAGDEIELQVKDGSLRGEVVSSAP